MDQIAPQNLGTAPPLPDGRRGTPREDERSKKKKPPGCLVALLGFLFSTFLVLAVLLINLNLTVLNSNFWKDWLQENEAYERVTNTLLPYILSDQFLFDGSNSSFFPSDAPEGEGLPMNWEEVPDVEGLKLEGGNSGQAYQVEGFVEGIEAMDEEGLMTNGESVSVGQIHPEVLTEVAKIVQEAVTPEWVQEETEEAIDSFFRWVYGQEKQLRIAFDLTPLQGGLMSGIEEVMAEQFNDLPSCPTGQQSPFDSGKLECKPAGFSFDAVTGEWNGEDMEESFPTELVIGEEHFAQVRDGIDQSSPGLLGDIAKLATDPPRLYRAFRIAIAVSVLFAAVCAGLILVLYRRDLAMATKVFGKTLLGPAITLLVVGLLGFLVVPFALSRLGSIEMPGGSSGGGIATDSSLYTGFMEPLFSSLIQILSFRVVMIGAVLLAGAILLLVIAALKKEKFPKETSEMTASQLNTLPPQNG